MIKKLATVFLLLVPSGIMAQNAMKKNELSKDYFLMDVADGTGMFAVKYKSASIAFDKRSSQFLLYGDADGTNIIFLEKVSNAPFKFYPDKFISCTYKDGKVYVASQVTGKATIITGIFNWTDEHLVWEKEESYDLSEIRVNRAKQLLTDGKVKEALLTYDSVEFAESYYDFQQVGIELLIGSKKNIEDLTAKRKYKEGAELAEKILAFKGMKWFADLKKEDEVKTAIGKKLHGLTYADLQLYIEAYTRNLVEAKSYDLAIEKVNLYWKYFTNSADLLLNIADAYYGKKDKTKASEYYEKYANQMKQLKKEKDIPTYVEQRIIKE